MTNEARSPNGESPPLVIRLCAGAFVLSSRNFAVLQASVPPQIVGSQAVPSCGAPASGHWYLHNFPPPARNEWGRGPERGESLRKQASSLQPSPPSCVRRRGRKALKTGRFQTCVDTNASGPARTSSNLAHEHAGPEAGAPATWGCAVRVPGFDIHSSFVIRHSSFASPL